MPGTGKSSGRYSRRLVRIEPDEHRPRTAVDDVDAGPAAHDPAARRAMRLHRPGYRRSR
ncbi:MAG: hypothetical protein KJZ81_05230 [Burkholderiaceae bacterium]|nr:hypothetical protein [Burkholderiaceae bacterium]